MIENLGREKRRAERRAQRAAARQARQQARQAQRGIGSTALGGNWQPQPPLNPMDLNQGDPAGGGGAGMYPPYPPIGGDQLRPMSPNPIRGMLNRAENPIGRATPNTIYGTLQPGDFPRQPPQSPATNRLRNARQYAGYRVGRATPPWGKGGGGGGSPYQPVDPGISGEVNDGSFDPNINPPQIKPPGLYGGGQASSYLPNLNMYRSLLNRNNGY